MTWWQCALVAYGAAGLVFAAHAIGTHKSWMPSDHELSWLGAVGLLISVTLLWPYDVFRRVQQLVRRERKIREVCRSKGIRRKDVKLLG